MTLEKNNEKGFTPIETELHQKLNWDFDLIVKCLNYIRVEIPNILDIEIDRIEVFLASITNFVGQNYPVIGIRVKPDFAKLIVIDFFEIEEKIEKWIEKIGGIEKLIEKSINFKSINWKSLEELNEYPKFE